MFKIPSQSTYQSTSQSNGVGMNAITSNLGRTGSVSPQAGIPGSQSFVRDPVAYGNDGQIASGSTQAAESGATSRAVLPYFRNTGTFVRNGTLTKGLAAKFFLILSSNPDITPSELMSRAMAGVDCSPTTKYEARGLGLSYFEIGQGDYPRRSSYLDCLRAPTYEKCLQSYKNLVEHKSHHSNPEVLPSIFEATKRYEKDHDFSAVNYGNAEQFYELLLKHYVTDNVDAVRAAVTQPVGYVRLLPPPTLQADGEAAQPVVPAAVPQWQAKPSQPLTEGRKRPSRDADANPFSMQSKRFHPTDASEPRLSGSGGPVYVPDGALGQMYGQPYGPAYGQAPADLQSKGAFYPQPQLQQPQQTGKRRADSDGDLSQSQPKRFNAGDSGQPAFASQPWPMPDPWGQNSLHGLGRTGGDPWSHLGELDTSDKWEQILDAPWSNPMPDPSPASPLPLSDPQGQPDMRTQPSQQHQQYSSPQLQPQSGTIAELLASDMSALVGRGNASSSANSAQTDPWGFVRLPHHLQPFGSGDGASTYPSNNPTDPWGWQAPQAFTGQGSYNAGWGYGPAFSGTSMGGGTSSGYSQPAATASAGLADQSPQVRHPFPARQFPDSSPDSPVGLPDF